MDAKIERYQQYLAVQFLALEENMEELKKLRKLSLILLFMFSSSECLPVL
jgi:hypothetical protein